MTRALIALGGAALAGTLTLSPVISSSQSLGVAGRDTWFAAEVRGAIVADHAGRVALGPAGGTYTISLGADGGFGAIVLTRLGRGPLRPGRYPIGESAALDSAGGFRALYLAGRATRPEGVFRAESGTLEIENSGPYALRGRVELVASGFVAANPDDETRRVHLTATFGTARTP